MKEFRDHYTDRLAPGGRGTAPGERDGDEEGRDGETPGEVVAGAHVDSGTHPLSERFPDSEDKS